MTKSMKFVLVWWSFFITAFGGLLFLFLFTYSDGKKSTNTDKLKAAKKAIKTLTMTNRNLDAEIKSLRNSTTVIKLRRCRQDLRAHFCQRYDVTGSGCKLAKKGESWNFALRHFFNDRIDLFDCSSRNGNPATKGMSRSELARWYKKGRECALYWVTMLEQPSSSKNLCYYDKNEVRHCSTIKWTYEKETFDE